MEKSGDKEQGDKIPLTKPQDKPGPEFEDDPVLVSAGDYQIKTSEFFSILPALIEAPAILINKDEFKDALKIMVEEKILEEKAIELGYDEDIDYQVEVERLEKELEVKKKQTLIKIMFVKEIDKQYKFDEKALKNFYANNRTKYEKRVFSEILRVVRHPNDEQEIKKVEKEIRMIYKKLKDGEKFEDLAREYYNGPEIYRLAGGQIGVIRRGKYPLDFETVGYEKLKKPGDISEPFLYNQGWSIIRLDKIVGFEEQVDYIKTEYERAQRTNINKKLVDSYLNPLKNPIKYNDMEIEKIIFEYKNE
ncbi:MAG TPA: hypothetical protein ENN73_04690 [Firmicutes bacterium]|nr:hypothetical protein [Bacillota bacterium]